MYLNYKPLCIFCIFNDLTIYKNESNYNDIVTPLDSENEAKKPSIVSGSEIQLEGEPRTGEYNLGLNLSPVKHNKWNQCTYQCAVCSKTSNSRSTITQHIVDDHGISFKEYRDKYPDLEVRS